MIGFVPDELFEQLTLLARREGHAVRFDRAVLRTIEDAIDEAGLRAEGRRESEPAAVLYAFGRRSVTFRPVARRFIAAVTHAQPSPAATISR